MGELGIFSAPLNTTPLSYEAKTASQVRSTAIALLRLNDTPLSYEAKIASRVRLIHKARPLSYETKIANQVRSIALNPLH